MASAMGKIEWRPNYGGAAGEYLAKQQACEHPWGNRKTSEYRRMYCGTCDVDFVLWAVVEPPADVPRMVMDPKLGGPEVRLPVSVYDRLHERNRKHEADLENLRMAGAATLLACDGGMNAEDRTVVGAQTAEGWPAAQAALRLRERFDKLQSETKRLQACERVAHDMHEALGIAWGEDPYRRIKQLRTYEANAQRGRMLKQACVVWDESVKACVDFILGGRFLHDQAPVAQWAREVAHALKHYLKNPYDRYTGCEIPNQEPSPRTATEFNNAIGGGIRGLQDPAPTVRFEDRRFSGQVLNPAEDQTLRAQLERAREDTKDFMAKSGVVGVSMMGSMPVIGFAARPDNLTREPAAGAVVEGGDLPGGATLQGEVRPPRNHPVMDLVNEPSGPVEDALYPSLRPRRSDGEPVPAQDAVDAVSMLRESVAARVPPHILMHGTDAEVAEAAAGIIERDLRKPKPWPDDDAAEAFRREWDRQHPAPPPARRSNDVFNERLGALQGDLPDRLPDPQAGTLAELVATMLSVYGVSFTDGRSKDVAIETWLRQFDAAAERKYGCRASCCESTGEAAPDVEDTRA